jgi:hypothetical protein
MQRIFGIERGSRQGKRFTEVIGSSGGLRSTALVGAEPRNAPCRFPTRKGPGCLETRASRVLVGTKGV